MDAVLELLLVIAVNAGVLVIGFYAVYWLNNDVRRCGK